jgi:hypothetical protein
MINKKRKPDTETKGKAKEKIKPEATKSEPVQEEHVPEEKVTPPVEEVTSIPTPEPTPPPTLTPETKVEPPATTQPPSKPKPLTLASLKTDVDALNKYIQLMDLKLEGFEALLALKRKPTANGKVQIRDKQTGKIYKSKNNVYQTLLREGELKDLVEKNIFGASPEKNTFGVYALFRAYPDRFEEVREPEKTE